MAHIWKTTDKEIPPNAVLVDRTTKWGNPFKVGVHGSRRRVLDMYRRWATARFNDNRDKFQRDMHDELKGRDLICHCAPQACHADYLAELAEQAQIPPDPEPVGVPEDYGD